MVGEKIWTKDGFHRGEIIEQYKFGSTPCVRIKWEIGEFEEELVKNIVRLENGEYKLIK